MTEAQSDLAFALKMYGDALVAYAKVQAADELLLYPEAYDNLCFWQNQANLCAQEIAKEVK